MSYPPLSWQTQDAEFSMPAYDPSGNQVMAPMMTLRHNGVLIHDRCVLPPEWQVSYDREPSRLYL